MIQFRVSTGDLERLRFAYSPLSELAMSAHMVVTGQVPRPHRVWYAMTRDRTRRLDHTLLAALGGSLADFLFSGAASPATTIEQQLHGVCLLSADEVRRDLDAARNGEPLPGVLEDVLAQGADASQRIADALFEYWEVALAPHWPRMRAVLDGDVAYRARQLTAGGIAALLSDLHPEISLHERALHIDKPRYSSQYELGGEGLVLVPSVFAWPHLLIEMGTYGVPSFTYAVRGVGTLWDPSGSDRFEDEDALGDLLGRSRAAVLTATALPISTTELAADLGQSAPAVSAHLSILRRNGLVRSWRSGRRVLYQRTPLAGSLIVAGSGGEDRGEHTA